MFKHKFLVVTVRAATDASVVGPCTGMSECQVVFGSAALFGREHRETATSTVHADS